MNGPIRFRLLKWYLDVITDEGRTAILYAAWLDWGRIQARYSSVLQSDVAGPPREAATIRGVERPTLVDGALTWEHRALGVRGSWSPAQPPIRRTLTRGPAGAIQWMCHMPRARAVVQLGDVTLAGRGYVESLRISLPPSKLMSRTLRWGRHVSDHHSVVWIDWIGEDERRWVWHDGREQPAATVTNVGLSGLADGDTLRFLDSRDVLERHVLTSLSGIVPALGRRMVGPLAGMHEHKKLSRSAIVRAGQAIDHGWALHEVVTW